MLLSIQSKIVYYSFTLLCLILASFKKAKPLPLDLDLCCFEVKINICEKSPVEVEEHRKSQVFYDLSCICNRCVVTTKSQPKKNSPTDDADFNSFISSQHTKKALKHLKKNSLYFKSN